jgi:hypothetical protein
MHKEIYFSILRGIERGPNYQFLALGFHLNINCWELEGVGKPGWEFNYVLVYIGCTLYTPHKPAGPQLKMRGTNTTYPICISFDSFRSKERTDSPMFQWKANCPGDELGFKLRH